MFVRLLRAFWLQTVVSKITLLGTSTGGFIAYACPPGYAGAGGRLPCTICPAGTYTMNPRSTGVSLFPPKPPLVCRWSHCECRLWLPVLGLSGGHLQLGSGLI